MIKSARPIGTPGLINGKLCLDFINTLGWRLGDDPEEKLGSFADLVTWSENEGLVSGVGARQMLDQAVRSPGRAAEVLKRAKGFRETLYHIFSDLAYGHTPEHRNVEELNVVLAEAMSRSGLVLRSGEVVWGWVRDSDSLEIPIWAAARSAAHLLTNGEAGRVGQCQDDNCGWLFIDKSKNRSRRWCSMDSCGNRAKARRHYKRTHPTAKGRATSWLV